jgi:hypothetical protein
MILNNGTIIFSFIAGAAIGSVVTWKVLKTKYDNLIQEEIDSVKEAYANRQGFDDTESKFVEECDIDLAPDEEKLDLKEMQKTLRELKYTNYSNDTKQEEVDIVDTNPYVISPEAFGDKDDYETVSLTYYSDGILTDDEDNIIKDVADTVGEESLKTFGEYEDDSVFVRNDRLKCDYEILLDTRKYSDVVGDEVDE